MQSHIGRGGDRNSGEARSGVIGVKRELAIEAMATRMPVKFETASEDPWLNAVVITATQPMRASAIQQVLEPATT